MTYHHSNRHFFREKSHDTCDVSVRSVALVRERGARGGRCVVGVRHGIMKLMSCARMELREVLEGVTAVMRSLPNRIWQLDHGVTVRLTLFFTVAFRRSATVTVCSPTLLSVTVKVCTPLSPATNV